MQCHHAADMRRGDANVGGLQRHSEGECEITEIGIIGGAFAGEIEPGGVGPGPRLVGSGIVSAIIKMRIVKRV